LVSDSPFFIDAQEEIKAEYGTAFIAAHDAMMRNFVSAMDDFCNAWTTSEAGVAWLGEIEKARHRPHCLQI
jgi:hypothetical protein